MYREAHQVCPYGSYGGWGARAEWIWWSGRERDAAGVAGGRVKRCGAVGIGGMLSS